MRRFVLEASTARRAAALGFVLLTMTSGAALAQTTGAVGPSPAPAQAAARDDMPPPGGCTPIGLTVSGEVVFPFACKGFIERQKGLAPRSAAAQEQRQAAEDQPAAADGKPEAAPQDKPASVEDKPAVTTAEKPADTPTDNAVPELSRPETRPGETIPLPRRADQKRTQLAMDPMCKHFRSYNAAAGTYKAFDGRMHPCK